MIGYAYDDGGRAASGRKGSAGDCTVRALCILRCLSYPEAYSALARANADYEAKARSKLRSRGGRSARNGVWKHPMAKVYEDFGLEKIKLPRGPRMTFTEAHARYGDCIVSTTKHVCAITGGLLRDTEDCRTYEFEDMSGLIETRERKAMSIWVWRPDG